VQGKENIAYFLYDGQNEIGSFNAHLQLQDLRILGHSPHAEIGASIAIEVAQQIYAPIHDLSGNIAALLPFDGGVLEQTRYSAFGEEIGSRISPWRFSSKRVDERNDLVYYGRRFYQPELGRWLSPDPAGFTDGMNLYAFVHNAPLTHFDEYGLLDMGQWDKTPKERFDEQQGINWGVSRWAKSVSSASIYSTAFVGKAMFPWLECTTPLVDLFSKSINRSIGRFTNHFTPYQFGNADFDRGRQIGYWGSEALSWMSLGFGAIKFGGYSSKFFLSAKNIKKIDPNIVRFSQSSIRNAFRNGMTIDELAISLKNGATKINEIPPIRLVNQNNVLYTLDNRRLEAFRRAGMKIPYKIATAEEIAAEAWKFTSKNGGIFVKIKGE
jgi:RHS repeat-associated protein